MSLQCKPCCTRNLRGRFGKTPWRLEILSRPKMPRRKRVQPSPTDFSSGVRPSALCGFANDRIEYASLPKLRCLIDTKLLFESIMPRHRLAIIDDYILRSRATPYNALSSFDPWPPRIPRDAVTWQPGQWQAFKRRLAETLAISKHIPEIPDQERVFVPIELLQPTCDRLSRPKRVFDKQKNLPSEWFRNPTKVSPAALKYTATPNIVLLAKPKPTFSED